MREYGEILEWVDLKKYNTYGIGGKAKCFIKPYNDKLRELLVYLEQENIKWYILGHGSNVILPDKDFDGVIISLQNLKNVEIKNDACVVDAGMSLGKLVQKTISEGYVNLAPFMGIPGTVGAAILGNVGAYGKEIISCVLDVTIIDEEKRIVTLKKEEIEYRYRFTEFKNRNIIIIRATLTLEKGNVDEAKKIIQENLQKRKNTQPLEYKNAGSVFKNPEGHSAGKLIDDLGLKGTTIGGAMISPKHANFIVNFNNAKSSDIIELIHLVKEKVKEAYNIELELEQIVIDW